VPDVGTLWRYEDLWQSPFGDVSHAFNVRPALRCSLPTFQCSAWRSVLVLLQVQPCILVPRELAGAGLINPEQLEETENDAR
jgi:hypothetical protein